MIIVLGSLYQSPNRTFLPINLEQKRTQKKNYIEPQIHFVWIFRRFSIDDHWLTNMNLNECISRAARFPYHDAIGNYKNFKFHPHNIGTKKLITTWNIQERICAWILLYWNLCTYFVTIVVTKTNHNIFKSVFVHLPFLEVANNPTEDYISSIIAILYSQ